MDNQSGITVIEDPKYDAWLLALAVAREELRDYTPEIRRVVDKTFYSQEFSYEEEYLLNLELISDLEEWSYQIRSNRDNYY